MKNRQSEIEDEIYKRHLRIAEMLEEEHALAFDLTRGNEVTQSALYIQ